MSGIRQYFKNFIRKNSFIKPLIFCVVCIIIIISILIVIVLNDFHSSEAYNELISFLDSDEIVAQCGDYIKSSPIVTGNISYTEPNKTAGNAALKIDFTSKGGEYSIYAYLSGTNGVWTVTSYELVER